MNKIIKFIKLALFIGEPVTQSVGLSQFKARPVVPQPNKTETKKEIKLSDLMRKS